MCFVSCLHAVGDQKPKKRKRDREHFLLEINPLLPPLPRNTIGEKLDGSFQSLENATRLSTGNIRYFTKNS